MYLNTKDNRLRRHENYGNWKMLVIYTNTVTTFNVL